jgi:phospholipid/cholesterol/gamma-HCH transport system substrate-binding protein
MKISNETKVGILTIAAVAILIIGFNFLKGKDIFSKSKHIHAVFENTGALSVSNEVKLKGLTIGTISDLKEVDKNVSGIQVTINLTKDINIPDNSVAYISAPLAGLGSSVLLIEPGNSTKYLADGDTLLTRVDEGLFGGLSSEVSPTLSKIRNALDSLNVVFSNVNKLFDENTKGNLKAAIANLSMATNSMNTLLDPVNSHLARTLGNVSSITENLKRNNDSITGVISNAKKFSNQLAQLNMQQTMDTLQAAITEFKYTISKLSSTDGTLGALIHDKKLYNKLNDVMLSAEILLDDLRTHPKRYVNLSIFGKKDKGGALNSPIKKDTVPQ